MTTNCYINIVTDQIRMKKKQIRIIDFLYQAHFIVTLKKKFILMLSVCAFSERKKNFVIFFFYLMESIYFAHTHTLMHQKALINRHIHNASALRFSFFYSIWPFRYLATKCEQQWIALLPWLRRLIRILRPHFITKYSLWC